MTTGDKGNSLESGDSPPTALQQTYAVVVTHRPDPEVMSRQFDRLEAERLKVVLVDNGSPDQVGIVQAAKNRGFECIALEHNLGVAGAQNAGIEKARALNGQYVLLLDQDSIPETGSVVALLRGLGEAPGDATPAAIGSSYTLPAGYTGSSFVRFEWFRFRKIYCEPGAGSLHEVDFLISSGTLIPLAVLSRVGPMRDELFIDHVDTEWFLRARSMGYRSFGCCDARMTHALGERVVRVWMGRWRTVPVHRAFRYYFTFRNSVWLYRQKYAPAKWITADLVRLAYIFVFSSVFLPSRVDNLRCMFRGMRDGFRDPGDWDSGAVVRATVDGGPTAC